MADTTTQIRSVADLVRKAETDYTSGTTKISKYVEVSMYETLNRIDAYANSKHISGDTDSLDREKPFFNIVTAAINIWFRATDLDRKNMRIKSPKAILDILAFLASVHLQVWMKKAKFGKYLNKWGRTLAKYGSAVTKFVEQKDELKISVVPWTRLICDAIDFYNNPVIEILELTPAQLRKREEYDQEMVEALILAHKSARKDIDGQTKDNKNEYIKVYEVHGELELSLLTENEVDDTKYQQQMQVISYVEKEEQDDEYQDFTLYRGREAKNPYKKDDLLEEDDQTLSIGAVQNLFESQWMVNHSIKQIKDQLDIASKIMFQTADPNFLGQNVLSAIENGDIMIHEINMPLTLIQTRPDIVSMQSFASQWQALGNQINGISEAMLGVQKSGQAWRQTHELLQESQSLFEIMTENKALALEEAMIEFIIPFIKTQMDTSEEISATLESYHLDKIDNLYIPNEAIRRYNVKATESVLNTGLPHLPPEMGVPLEANQIQTDLKSLGNQRSFKPSDIPTKTWKELLQDIEWEFEYDITQEQKDTQMVMDTLTSALKLVTSATPEQLADPNFKLVFNELLRQTAVISPIQIASVEPAPPPPPQNKVSESLSYKDAPPDVQRQIEEQAGLQPSKMSQVPSPLLNEKTPNLSKKTNNSNK